MSTDSRTEAERLARFLARHAVSEREAVQADVAPHLKQSLEDSLRDVDLLSRDALFQLSLQPDPLAVAAERDEPHPTYRAVMARLREEYRRAKAAPA